MAHFDPISIPELLDCINASKYREKTKRKLRRIVKKANGCVSLAACLLYTSSACMVGLVFTKHSLLLGFASNLQQPQ